MKERPDCKQLQQIRLSPCCVGCFTVEAHVKYIQNIFFSGAEDKVIVKY